MSLTAHMRARCAVRITPRVKLEWSWPKPSCARRATLRGVLRMGGLCLSGLCCNERGAAPIPPASDARGYNVSYARDHVRNNLCGAEGARIGRSRSAATPQ